MKINDFIDKFMASDFVKTELPIQIQLGIPYLFKRNNQLCVMFCPHKEEYFENSVAIYEKQYLLEVIYPSCKVMKFVDLIHDNKIQSVKKIKETDVSWLTNYGKYIINNLYDSLSEILEFYDRNGKVSDMQIKEYQKNFDDAIERLGLSELYGVKL